MVITHNKDIINRYKTQIEEILSGNFNKLTNEELESLRERFYMPSSLDKNIDNAKRSLTYTRFQKYGEICK